MATNNSFASFRLRQTRSSWAIAFFSVVLLLSVAIGRAEAVDSCPNCGNADAILKPCNTELKMETWPGVLVYQPTLEQAPCACNQNYYDQMVGCLKCQSSESAHYSVKDQKGYELVCLSFGQKWQEIYFPSSSTTAAAPTTTTTATTATIGSGGNGGATIPTSIDSNPTAGDKISSGHVNSNLSSGAVAGIVVSIIALIVALSVAGYVWRRRRRDRAHEAGDLDEFKYRDTQSDTYMEAALPQYTGMIQPALPPISKVSNLRVMNPDSDDDDMVNAAGLRRNPSAPQQSFEVRRTSSPGWRRGSFDDD